MEVSGKALYYADVCVSGDIVSESQAPYLARNFQVLIDEYETRIAELEAQLAAALATIERTTWCEVCGLPAAHCRENH